jgi:hypothetical protein
MQHLFLHSTLQSIQGGPHLCCSQLNKKAELHCSTPGVALLKHAQHGYVSTFKPSYIFRCSLLRFPAGNTNMLPSSTHGRPRTAPHQPPARNTTSTSYTDMPRGGQTASVIANGGAGAFPCTRPPVRPPVGSFAASTADKLGSARYELAICMGRKTDPHARICYV